MLNVCGALLSLAPLSRKAVVSSDPERKLIVIFFVVLLMQCLAGGVNETRAGTGRPGFTWMIMSARRLTMPCNHQLCGDLRQAKAMEQHSSSY